MRQNVCPNKLSWANKYEHVKSKSLLYFLSVIIYGISRVYGSLTEGEIDQLLYMAMKGKVKHLNILEWEGLYERR